jgi:hypothetical protein
VDHVAAAGFASLWKLAQNPIQQPHRGFRPLD